MVEYGWSAATFVEIGDGERMFMKSIRNFEALCQQASWSLILCFFVGAQGA